MRVFICIPDLEERAFCRKRIYLLSKAEGIELTIHEIKTEEVKESYFDMIDFDDADLIYIGVDNDFNGINIAKSIRKAGISRPEHAKVISGMRNLVSHSCIFRTIRPALTPE